MEFSNQGESFYHRFQGSFLSSEKGELLHCTGSRQQWLHDNWSSVNSDAQPLDNADVKIYQTWRASQHNRTAVLVNSQLPRLGQAAFEDFFVQLILDQADLCCTNTSPADGTDVEAVTQSIVDLFDSFLRYQGKDDKWVAQGRAYFTERLRHFTTQNAQIEFCLPAFPCKSSNQDKVTGSDPDQGEELALQRLHGFVEAIEHVYAPGAKLWVISDGGVFSDCIGVDDADVDEYGEKLKAMNHAIGLRRGNTDRIGFKSLVDLFQLATVQLNEGLEALAARLNIPTIDHHVKTQVTEEAELCRRVLMAGCAPQKSAVRAKINSKDAGITALYRGFSRFMLEDLEHHPHTRGMTRSQQKKLSANIALEMILVRGPLFALLSLGPQSLTRPNSGTKRTPTSSRCSSPTTCACPSMRQFPRPSAHLLPPLANPHPPATTTPAPSSASSCSTPPRSARSRPSRPTASS